jgi:hypothetical protein
MIDGTLIRSRFEAMRSRLDERARRLFCAAEARSAGYGGVSAVARPSTADHVKLLIPMRLDEVSDRLAQYPWLRQLAHLAGERAYPNSVLVRGVQRAPVAP